MSGTQPFFVNDAVRNAIAAKRVIVLRQAWVPLAGTEHKLLRSRRFELFARQLHVTQLLHKSGNIQGQAEFE